MSTWSIGDVHGHASALDAQLEYLTLRVGDQIVFLGDLIDRGPRTPDALPSVGFDRIGHAENSLVYELKRKICSELRRVGLLAHG